MVSIANLQAKTLLVEATVGPDGALILPASSALPLKPGEKVSVAISILPELNKENPYPLQGATPYVFHDPLEPAIPIEEWEGEI